MYSAAKFTIFHVNSPKKFTLFHEIFFFTGIVWTKLNIASYELFHKKSFVLKTIHVTSSYRKNKRYFVKKLMRGYI
jgi:hypothetical protein